MKRKQGESERGGREGDDVTGTVRGERESEMMTKMLSRGCSL